MRLNWRVKSAVWFPIRGLVVSRHCSLLPLRRRPASSLLVAASNFSSVLNQSSPTVDAYKNSPLTAISPPRRGAVLESVVRSIYSNVYADQVSENSIPGRCVNGSMRSLYNAEYDWLCNGRRVECKSSQLRWSNRDGWLFKFSHIKFKLFDDLLLALYTPQRLYIYRHDRELGLSSVGIATSACGRDIYLYSARREQLWRTACDIIITKLDADSNSCERITDMPIDDVRILLAVSAHRCDVIESAYKNVPLAKLSPAFRALRLEALVRCVDQIIHPDCCLSDPRLSGCHNGWSRGLGNADHDWIRDSRRVECKAAQLSFDRRYNRWHAVFKNIKVSCFDELLLALYSPRGVYIYRHDFNLALQAQGKVTELRGMSLAITGPRNYEDWSASLDAILLKLDGSGCERLALVTW